MNPKNFLADWAQAYRAGRCLSSGRGRDDGLSSCPIAAGERPSKANNAGRAWTDDREQIDCRAALENLSEEKADAYIAEGIQDEILTRLAKIADLKVISRASMQHYKSAPDNLPDSVGRQKGPRQARDAASYPR